MFIGSILPSPGMGAQGAVVCNRLKSVMLLLGFEGKEEVDKHQLVFLMEDD